MTPLEEIRSRFPALQRRHRGHPVAYFDGPGGTQVPRSVVEAMADYLYHHNANTHWAYPTSAETDRLLEEARLAFADFLGCEPDTIAFGNNMTTLTFHVARAIGRDLKQGEEIVVTDLDHHANIDPWLDLAQERGLVVRHARFDTATGTLDWDHLESLISGRTRLLAVGAASNALGTVNDVARACRLARAAGAFSYVDAVHYAAHYPPAVRDWDCDFLACSAYKFYGPHAGVLHGRKELLDLLSLPRLVPAPDAAPEKLETGTQNHEGIAGAAAAVNFLASLAPGASRRERLQAAALAIHKRTKAQLAAMWSGLAEIDGVTLYGPRPDTARTPTLSFTVRGNSSEEVCRTLAEEGLFLSHGDFYAMTVVRKLGVEGLVRAGCACYTTPDEVERLVRAVARIRPRARP